MSNPKVILYRKIPPIPLNINRTQGNFSLSQAIIDSTRSTLRSVYAKDTLNSTPKIPTNRSICRVCFDPQSNMKGHLINPCHCIGSGMYIHESCLKTWIKNKQQEPNFKPKCEFCTFEYLHQFVILDQYSCKKTCNTLLICALIAVLGIVASIALSVLFSMISNGKSDLPIYIVCGIGITSIAGIIVYRIRNCHANWYDQVFKEWKILNIKDEAGVDILNRRNEEEKNLKESNISPGVHIPIKQQPKKGFDSKLYSDLAIQYPFFNEVYVARV